MRVVVVTPPEPVISIEEAFSRLRLEHDDDGDDETDVMRMAVAATKAIDGPTGWLGRCVGKQTLEARLDNWDCGSLRLPFPPVVSVVSVTYVDALGVVQAVAPEAYELLGASLVPAYGHSWPQARWQREAVRVRYVAGYDEADPVAAQDLETIKAAILLMAGDLFRWRDTTTGTLTSKVPMSTTVENLLNPYRVY